MVYSVNDMSGVRSISVCRKRMIIAVPSDVTSYILSDLR